MPTWGRRCALEVRQDGDAALARLAKRFDKAELSQACRSQLEGELRAAKAKCFLLELLENTK